MALYCSYVGMNLKKKPKEIYRQTLSPPLRKEPLVLEPSYTLELGMFPLMQQSLLGIKRGEGGRGPIIPVQDCCSYNGEHHNLGP